MADINTSIQLLESLIRAIEKLTGKLDILVGGVFGIYIIMLILKWREYFMMKKFKKEIKQEIASIKRKRK